MNQSTLIISAGIPLLANRETTGKSQWIHIVPKGELANAEAGVVQVLDDEALDSILENFQADSARLGDRWPGVYGGEEHWIYDPEKSSQAFMWGREFEKRDDGIWTRGDLTDVGEAALKNKRFKFTSFVADPRVPGSIEKLDGNRVRVLRVDTFGFTNFANGKDLLTPILNRSAAQITAFTGYEGDSEIARRLVNRAHELKTERANMTFRESWDRARAELAAPSTDSVAHAARKMLNRASALKDAGAALTFDACWRQARNEMLSNLRS